MDLDGTWYDGPTPDGIYDYHYAGFGDIEPEIYVGRIDATSRTLGGLTNVQNILNLLNKLHSYRTGGIARTHRAITYIDDDWKAWADGTNDNWPGWLQHPYPIRTDVHTPTTWTNATNWLNRMTQDYEWAHLCVHSGSNPAWHYFGPGGSGEGTVTAAQIDSTQPTFNFYNLFCCKGANWLDANCLAVTYLYSSSYSIGVIATTKTGGMFYGNYFYNTLYNNETIGKSLYQWFQLMQYYEPTYYLEWFYGMVILGDPFLTIHYDNTVLPPEISSISHPNEYQWSMNPTPQFSWTEPVDVNGIVGYYYILDQNPYTVPTTSTGAYTTLKGYNVSTLLAEGAWYLHVVAKDGAGNVGVIADHYQILIDYSNPVVSILSPLDKAKFKPGLIEVSWSVTDLGSGYHSAYVRVNGVADNCYVNPTSSAFVNISTSGTYVINITAYDFYGFTGSDEVTIKIAGFTSTLQFKIILYASIGVVALLIVFCPLIVIRKHRRSVK